jgi:general stress protein 26
MNSIGPAERNENIKKLREMIKDIDFCMLTTIEEDGQTLRSRPMSTQKVEFDGDLWFFTKLKTAKVEEIQQDQDVNVSYAKPSNQFVSVSGKATVVQDRNKMEELWQPALKAWFPDGLDDPNLALLRVNVTQAEYWDSPASKVVELIGMVKAVVTGKEFEPGENEKFNLR